LHLSSTGIIKYEDKEDYRSNHGDAAQCSESQRDKNDGTFECASKQMRPHKISTAVESYPADKVLVFSGKSNQRRLHTKKRGEGEQECVLGSPSSFSYRNNLFTELQSRIDGIELADEWDANQERNGGSDVESDDDTHQGVNEDDDSGAPFRKAMPQAMPLVLDGGSLFAELTKSTIAFAASEGEGEEVVLGDSL